MLAIGMMINAITATKLVIMRAIAVVNVGTVVLGRVHPVVTEVTAVVIRVLEVVLQEISVEVTDVIVAVHLLAVTVAVEAVDVTTAAAAEMTPEIASLAKMTIGSVRPLLIRIVEPRRAPVETASVTNRSSSATSGTLWSVRRAKRIGSL